MRPRLTRSGATMDQRTDNAGSPPRPSVHATIRLATRNEIAGLSCWRKAFARERKDHRYYELVEDTLTGEFDFGYLMIEDGGAPCAVQPYFIVDQDLLAGTGDPLKLAAGIRRLWPRFMRARTLMLGCAAGEGHLDGDEHSQSAIAELLARSLMPLARQLDCALVVFKEFPARYRAPLECLRSAGFTRVPSMPMTTLVIDFRTFDEYLAARLSSVTRATLRRKLRVAARVQPAISLSVVSDAGEFVDDLYPLYEKVFERSALKFEKLTREFLREIGTRMPDRARFFIWRQDARIIAFALCLVHDDAIWHEYIGFDYSVAFPLHLYYRVFHDLIEWAMANGCRRFYSGSLNYDPKLHLRQSLYPVDLYVRHTSAAINAILKRLLPWMEPTHSDPILPKFHNYTELWGPPSGP
jgi:predicted N-acyltransferase